MVVFGEAKGFHEAVGNVFGVDGLVFFEHHLFFIHHGLGEAFHGFAVLGMEQVGGHHREFRTHIDFAEQGIL